MPCYMLRITRSICTIIVIASVLVMSAADNLDNPKAIRANAIDLFEKGNYEGLLLYLQKVESRYHDLVLNDSTLPSLYSYRGVALYNSQRLDEATQAFQQAVTYFPADTRSWINLGEVFTQRFAMVASIEAYSVALSRGDKLALTHLLRAKGWINDWRSFEEIAAAVERDVRTCMRSVLGEFEGDHTTTQAITHIPAHSIQTSSRSSFDLDNLQLTALCYQFDSSAGFEYTYLNGHMQKIGHLKLPNARPSSIIIPDVDKAAYWERPRKDKPHVMSTSTRTAESSEKTDEDSDDDDSPLALPGGPEKIVNGQASKTSIENKYKAKGLNEIHYRRRIKVGIASADFGVHPVSTLVRGLLQFIDRDVIELFCFSLQPKVSWWGKNISQTVEHFINLPQINSPEAAAHIAGYGIEILIDLNGHTQFSGVRMMAHRPAPVQMSFLGLPSTTGTEFIDYFLGDAVALPAEHANHFTESLAIIPGCYIVNDYAQLQGDMVDFIAPTSGNYSLRAPRELLSADFSLKSASFVFATFSNAQKLDPNIYYVWMNILRGFPGSKLVHIGHHGSSDAMPNVRKFARHHGVQADHIVLSAQAPWINHLYLKSAIDMVLDSPIKNGHTTGLDGIWAGIPTVTFATGTTMQNRAGQSMMAAQGSNLGISFSVKDYEDSVYRLRSRHRKNKHQEHVKAADKVMRDDKIKGGSNPGKASPTVLTAPSIPGVPSGAPYPSSLRLDVWRKDQRERRLSGTLFDTKLWTLHFQYQMQGIWELAHLRTKQGNHFHVITGKIKKDELTQVHQAYTSVSPFYSKEVGVSRRGDKAVIMDEEVVFEAPVDDLRRSAIDASAISSQNSSAAEKKDVPLSAESTSQVFVPSPLPADLFDGRILLLNIGGFTKKEGWYNVNSQEEVIVVSEQKVQMQVDIRRMMHDLVGFPNKSVSAIYASHILEHASLAGSSKQPSYLVQTLKEWYRVLKPGGLLMISVPDLTTVFQLYLQPNITLAEKWLLTRVIYGAQTDKYDFHHNGFDEAMLTYFLQFLFLETNEQQAQRPAGQPSHVLQAFCDIERVNSFNLFSDSSEIVMHGKKISLNLAARRCPTAQDTPQERSFRIEMNATPYVPMEFPQPEICHACKKEKNAKTQGKLKV